MMNLLRNHLIWRLREAKKIAIKGVNGIGKIHFIENFAWKTKSVAGRNSLGATCCTRIFEQEDSKKNTNTAVEEVWNAFPSMTNREIRLELARCGPTNEHYITDDGTFGRRKCKVRLCKVMLEEINLLVLDEPTNHLDVEAKKNFKKQFVRSKALSYLFHMTLIFIEGIVDEVLNTKLVE